MIKNYEVDLKKLAAAYWREFACHDEGYIFIGVGGKRPFGNSSIAGDILEILELEPESEIEPGCWSHLQYEYAEELYNIKLAPYLKEKCQKLFQ